MSNFTNCNGGGATKCNVIALSQTADPDKEAARQWGEMSPTEKSTWKEKAAGAGGASGERMSKWGPAQFGCRAAAEKAVPIGGMARISDGAEGLWFWWKPSARDLERRSQGLRFSHFCAASQT